MENFELNLSHEELVKRTDKEHLIPKKMLDVGASEYENLAQGDKEALKHLTKAAYAVNDVFMQQDNHKNLAFKQWLEAEIEKGSEDARLTKILFDAQIGMNAVDSEANKIFLAKGEKSLPGKGFYPADLSVEDFHNILIKMLKNGKKDEVKAILNQRSMVLREGDELKAVDFTEFFKKEFGYIADELEEAAKTSTNSDFNEFLTLRQRHCEKTTPCLTLMRTKNGRNCRIRRLSSQFQENNMLTR